MIAALVASAAGFCVPTAGAPGAVAVVDAYLQAYNRHDLKGIRRVIAADTKMGNPGHPLTGAEVVGRYETIVFKRFPKVKVEWLNRLSAGDLVAQTERVTGISAKAETGLSVYRVRRGCIVEMSINQ